MSPCNPSIPHTPQCGCYPIIAHPHWEKLPTRAPKIQMPTHPVHSVSDGKATATANKPRPRPYPFTQDQKRRAGRLGAWRPDAPVPSPSSGVRIGETTIAGLCDDDRTRLASLVEHLALAHDQKQVLQTELVHLREQLQQINSEKGNVLVENRAITRRLHKAESVLRQYRAAIGKAEAEEAMDLEDGTSSAPALLRQQPSEKPQNQGKPRYAEDGIAPTLNLPPPHPSERPQAQETPRHVQELQTELGRKKEGLRALSAQLEQTNAEKGKILARNRAITRRLNEAEALLEQYNVEIDKTAEAMDDLLSAADAESQSPATRLHPGATRTPLEPSHQPASERPQNQLRTKLVQLKEELRELRDQLGWTNAEKSNIMAWNKAIMRRMHKAESLLEQYNAITDEVEEKFANLQNAFPAPVDLESLSQHTPSETRELREQLERTNAEKSNILAWNKAIMRRLRKAESLLEQYNVEVEKVEETFTKWQEADLESLSQHTPTETRELREQLQRTNAEKEAIKRRLHRAESLLKQYNAITDEVEEKFANLQDAFSAPLSQIDAEKEVIPQRQRQPGSLTEKPNMEFKRILLPADLELLSGKEAIERAELDFIKLAENAKHRKSNAPANNDFQSQHKTPASQSQPPLTEVLPSMSHQHQNERPQDQERPHRSSDEEGCCSDDKLPAAETGQWLPRTDLNIPREQDRAQENPPSTLPEQRPENNPAISIPQQTAPSQLESRKRRQQELAELTATLAAQVSAAGPIDTTATMSNLDSAVPSGSSFDPLLRTEPVPAKRNSWPSDPGGDESNASSASRLPELADLLRGVLRKKSSRPPATEAHGRPRQRDSRPERQAHDAQQKRKQDRATSPTPPDSFATSAAAPEPVYHSTREIPTKRYEPQSMESQTYSGPESPRPPFADEQSGWRARPAPPVVLPPSEHHLRDRDSSHRRPASPLTRPHFYDHESPLSVPVTYCPLCPPGDSLVSSSEVYENARPTSQQAGPRGRPTIDASLLFPNDTSMIRPLIDILDDLDTASANARSKVAEEKVSWWRSRRSEPNVKAFRGAEPGGHVPPPREHGILDGILDGFSFDHDESASSTATSAETGSARRATRGWRRAPRQHMKVEDDDELASLITSLNSR
ncbi:hypothetical protein HDU88_000358 [Geranomyces variabilis]|nr:hypothetical protein HDU88_000358 [Geranomyces variabilis]